MTLTPLGELQTDIGYNLNLMSWPQQEDTDPDNTNQTGNLELRLEQRRKLENNSIDRSIDASK